MAQKGWITLVERGYSLEGSEEDWLRGVLSAAAPLLDRGLGTAGWTFEWHDRTRPSGIVGFGPDLRSDPILRWGAELLLDVILRPEDLEAGYRPDRAFATASDLLGGSHEMARHPLFDPTWRTSRLGSHVRWSAWASMVDCRRALAVNPGGPGVMLVGALDRFENAHRSEAGLWGRAMVHVAAGLRLRRRFEQLVVEGDGDAVLSLDGRVHHAEGDATQPLLLSALRRATVDIDRARGSLRREDADAALEKWRGLVDGRWTLIDRFDRDGRHFLVARRNDPMLRDPRGLTSRERSVVAYAALGWANKEIAYALGIRSSTAATLLARAMAKLGSTRVGLSHSPVEPSTLPASTRHSSLHLDDDELAIASFEREHEREDDVAALTAAEREVARMAIEGLSNAAISSRRRTALRTVANQLAAVYRKLGVQSRAELAARFWRRRDARSS